MKRWIFLSLTMALMLILSACNDNGGTDGDQETEEPATTEDTTEDATTEDATEETDTTEDAGTSGETSGNEEVVTLIDTNEEEVATATLTEDESGVNVAIEGENLPAGELGFHFHDTGSCELPDFESAGDHYNPTDANHGFDDPDGPHAGDMENIEVAEDGTVDTEVTADMVTLEEDQDNTLYPEGGTALLIHSDADDYASQPSGDAGDRVACGVVGE